MHPFISAVLEIVVGGFVFIAAIMLIIVCLIAVDTRRTKQKEKALRVYKLPNEKAESVVEKVISQHVRDDRKEKEREEKYKLATKRRLKEPSLLYKIIMKVWQKKKEEGIWPSMRITGKNKQEEIKIDVKGEREDTFPNEVKILLTRIPGFAHYVSKELVELTSEEKRKIEYWIAANASTE